MHVSHWAVLLAQNCVICNPSSGCHVPMRPITLRKETILYEDKQARMHHSTACMYTQLHRHLLRITERMKVSTTEVRPAPMLSGWQS